MFRKLSCKLNGFLVAALCLSGANACLGQSVHSEHIHRHHRHAFRHVPHYSLRGGYHASTAAEGYARGLADVVRARGENNLHNALAQREWEAARKLNLENRVLKVQAFYERREIYRQNHAQQIAEQREKAEARLARLRLTELTHEEFNRDSGVVNWPPLLADAAFADYAAWFDALFAERAKYGELSAGTLGEAEMIIKEWRADITAVKDQVPEALLRDSLRFLLRLNRELEQLAS